MTIIINFIRFKKISKVPKSNKKNFSKIFFCHFYSKLKLRQNIASFNLNLLKGFLMLLEGFFYYLNVLCSSYSHKNPYV